MYMNLKAEMARKGITNEQLASRTERPDAERPGDPGRGGPGDL